MGSHARKTGHSWSLTTDMVEISSQMKIWRECSADGCMFVSTKFGKHTDKNGNEHVAGVPVRWTEPHDYQSAHKLVRALRGAAQSYPCTRCDDTEHRHEWALSPDKSIWRQQEWSSDPWDYEPLCCSCHKRTDATPEQLSEIAIERQDAIRQRRASDPVFDEHMKAVGAESALRNLHNDPAEVARRGRIGGSRGGVLVGTIRRQCGGCSLVTTPGALGRHQAATGHTGWTGAK